MAVYRERKRKKPLARAGLVPGQLATFENSYCGPLVA